MALTQCKECAHQISDQATACPNCGAPGNPAKPAGKNWLTIMAFVIVGLIAFVVIFSPSEKEQRYLEYKAVCETMNKDRLIPEDCEKFARELSANEKGTAQ